MALKFGSGLATVQDENCNSTAAILSIFFQMVVFICSGVPVQ